MSISARSATSLRGQFSNTNSAGWDLRGNIGSQAWDKVVLQWLSDESLPYGQTKNANNGYFAEYGSKIADWIHSGSMASTFTDAGWFGSAAAATAATGESTTSANTTRSIPVNQHVSPNTQVYLYETWARPDYVKGGTTATIDPTTGAVTGTSPGPGYFSTLQQMTDELHTAYGSLGANTARFAGVAPVGDAFQNAVNAGLASPPGSSAAGKPDLWWDDELHASRWGSYLSALTLYGETTGKDPRARRR